MEAQNATKSEALAIRRASRLLGSVKMLGEDQEPGEPDDAAHSGGDVMSEEQQDVRRFTLPRGQGFTLLASWWTESGMEGFERRSKSYRFAAAPNISLVALEDIAPMKMDDRLHLGHGGFSRRRMTEVLRAIASDRALPPIEVVEPWHSPYKYVIGGGVHRFYGSVAAGFSQIPIVRRWLPKLPKHVLDKLVQC